VGRVCYAIEIDPLYVDATVRRWEKHTGEKAVGAATGECFDQAEVMRG
jgi:DNA modification methylase